MLSDLKCNLDNDDPFRLLLGDDKNKKYLLVNVEDKRFESYKFPIGEAVANSQVEYSQDEGTTASWGTSAKETGSNPQTLFGKGEGEVFAWNQPAPDGDGAFLMRLNVTEAYRKANGKLDGGDSDKKTGDVRVEIQGVCR